MTKSIKTLIAVLAISGLITLASPASLAQTSASPTSIESLINQLQAQLNALRAQIDALIAARTVTAETTVEIRDTLKLLSGLREGMTGEEVRLLQVALSSDSEIYPEGLVTGYYGRATAEAVRRLQRKHGMEAVGYVGPRTIEKINDILKGNPVVKDEKTGEPCAIIPPGHLIASGWQRLVGARPIIPECQTIPPGIQRQLSEISAKDVVAPGVTEITASEITTNSTRVSWVTNEQTIGLIRYGVSTPLSSGAVMELADNNPKTAHGHILSGLQSNTVYYYTITATDIAGNMTTSAEFMFRTLSSDTTAPSISGMSATSITQTSAVISWITDEPATSKVWLTTNMTVDTTGSPTMENSLLVTNHNLSFSNLTFGTVYRYVVASTDSSGNTTKSSEFSFTTTSGGGGGGGGY